MSTVLIVVPLPNPFQRLHNTIMLGGPHSMTSRSSSAKAVEPSRLELILVVDDDPDCRDAVRTVLEGAGYRIAEAKDGREALAFVQKALEKPALLLLDLMMPTMDGWQLRGQLRSDPELAAIPIVIMTAHVGVLRAVSNATPATPVLAKPLDVDRLLQMVATYSAVPTPRGAALSRKHD
jgi:CheY-like chemotaxis protein